MKSFFRLLLKLICYRYVDKHIISFRLKFNNNLRSFTLIRIVNFTLIIKKLIKDIKMLQNGAVNKEIRIVQQPPRSNNPIVLDRPITITNRIPLPISTIQSQNANLGSRTYLPRSGYEILDEMPSVHVEQTFALTIQSSAPPENRYIVRSPLGEALFAVTESSTEQNRKFWGNLRPFQMHLVDKTHQEALMFKRKNALGFLCCQQRSMEIWSPPGDLIGAILEEPSIFKSEFSIRKDGGEIIYLIKSLANKTCCNFMLPNEGHFDIVTPEDPETSKGSITRKWSQNLSLYNLNIYFNDINMDVKSKALFLGAAFFVEYLCFSPVV